MAFGFDFVFYFVCFAVHTASHLHPNVDRYCTNTKFMLEEV